MKRSRFSEEHQEGIAYCLHCKLAALRHNGTDYIHYFSSRKTPRSFSPKREAGSEVLRQTASAKPNSIIQRTKCPNTRERLSTGKKLGAGVIRNGAGPLHVKFTRLR